MKYKHNIYSQNGEDGIIGEVFLRIGEGERSACEFGSADGYFCSNTRALIDKGWSCVMLEGSRGEWVTPENVNQLVPQTLDLLSIDIDGNDYAVWKEYKGSARVVIIEINSSLDPSSMFFSPERGASFAAMNELGYEKGYFLLTHTGNMIFVDSKYEDLFPESRIDDMLKFDRRWL